MGKLMSSIKSLQDAITSLNPIGPTCIQEAITHSFREVADSSSNSICNSKSRFNYISSLPSSVSSSSSPSSRTISKLNETNHIEDSLSSSTFPLPELPITSTRFYYSPRTTKSIMEERSSLRNTEPNKDAGNLWEVSIPLVMASDNPYRDFKQSMEEMVEAHGIRELPMLKELLHCYLRLNEKKSHKSIVLAFLGLLIDLEGQDKYSTLSSFPSTASSSCHHSSDSDIST